MSKLTLAVIFGIGFPMLLLFAMTPSYMHTKAEDNYIYSYGNGIYYVEGAITSPGDASDRYTINIGPRLTQFKQLHQDCKITAMTSFAGRYGTLGVFVNCELR